MNRPLWKLPADDAIRGQERQPDLQSGQPEGRNSQDGGVREASSLRGAGGQGQRGRGRQRTGKGKRPGKRPGGKNDKGQRGIEQRGKGERGKEQRGGAQRPPVPHRGRQQLARQKAQQQQQQEDGEQPQDIEFFDHSRFPKEFKNIFGAIKPGTKQKVKVNIISKVYCM